MKSDIIVIDSQGNGYDLALKEAKKVAVFTELNHKSGLQLQLCAEELLSLARSVTGEIKASCWIETEGNQFCLHLSTKTEMDKEKRGLLISASTTRKNEAAKSFLGKIRDSIEEALAAEVDHSDQIPDDLYNDLANRVIECADPEWDGYEQSTLRRLADRIAIGIRGGKVDITVVKSFT